MTTIYAVTEHDNMIRFYWYATKREAEEHWREWKLTATEDDTCEIDTVQFPISKAGIVEALNYVVSLTCLNEG